MTLYTVLRHEIGRKSDTFVAPWNLGIKERMVAFAEADKNAVAKKCSIESTTSCPITSQLALKKPEVRPSGLGLCSDSF